MSGRVCAWEAGCCCGFTLYGASSPDDAELAVMRHLIDDESPTHQWTIVFHWPEGARKEAS